MRSFEKRLSDRVQAIKPSAIRRFFDLANEMKGQVISLSIGEPDFVTPWGIRQAGVASLDEGYTHYSPNQGYQELREAIALYLKRRFDLDYDVKDEILVTVGGSEALDLAMRAVLNPGDEVIVPEPAFIAYAACARLADAVPVTVGCSPEDNFKLTPSKLEAAITPRTKMVVLAFPNNPTGAVLNRSELLEIAAIVEKHDLLVLADELYIELCYLEEGTTSFASLPGMWERTILVNGFSKSFAMTGWRIGYAAAPKEMLAAMKKIHQYAILSSPSTAQYAAIEALNQAEKYIAPMRTEYNLRRRYIVAALDQMGLSCSMPDGAFYAFPDIRPTGLSSNDFCEEFLKEEKVAIVPGSAFGESGEGFVRISYAASMANIREAMIRLERFIKPRIAAQVAKGGS